MVYRPTLKSKIMLTRGHYLSVNPNINGQTLAIVYNNNNNSNNNTGNNNNLFQTIDIRV